MNKLKSYLIVVFCLLSYRGHSLTLKVIDPCSGDEVIDHKVTKQFKNVGQLSFDILFARVPDFQGSKLGIRSMFATPVGEASLEIISQREMRSYGWCYSVDGISPEVYPLDFLIDDSHQVIEWFFGYAHYDSGTWITQCERTHVTKPSFICSKD